MKQSLDFETLVAARRSIRGYKPDPIPQHLMAEIIEIAKRAPSSMNTQPWNFHAITGAPLELIREGNTERMMAGAAVDREIKTADHGYQGVHRDRQVEIAIQLFEAMGIERDDKVRRQDWVMRGFRQFDAPVSVIGCIDRAVEGMTESYFNLGQFVHAMVLAAWDRGVGAVINGQGIMQSSVVRAEAQIPDDQLIVITVAMGFPLDDFAANDVVSERRSVEEIATYRGF